MTYQPYQFIEQNNNSNNPYIQNNIQNNNYADNFDTTVSQYSQSGSDFFQANNMTPHNTDYNTNGRVFFNIKEPTAKYNLFDEKYKTQSDIQNILNYSQESTPLSNAYFSQTNINTLQMMIKQKVFQQCEQDNDPILTNHKPIHINNQDETALKIIMRSIYLQYAKNSPINIGEQILELNQLVLNESVPDIITNLKQYLGYITDIQRLPNPLDHPSYVSSKGEKTYSLLIV